MAEVIAFTNAHVYDGHGGQQKGRTVVIEDGKITGIGQGEAPSRANVIDLDGRTLMPGMTVGHWHGEFLNIGPPIFSSGRGGVFLGTEEPPAVLAVCAATSLQTALMSGVTRIVSGSCSNDLDWQMKMSIERGLFDGPRLTPCSRHMVTTGDYEDRGHWWKADRQYDGVRRIGGNVFADGTAEIAKAVRQEIARGAEVIKVLPTGGHGFAYSENYRGQSRHELETVVRTAHERDARVRAHTASARSILECLEIGVDIIDHADLMDEACIESLVKHKATFIPSLLFTKLVSYGGKGQARPGKEMDAAWDNMRVMLPKANAAGVNIVPGDDFGAQGMEHALGVYARELLVYTEDMGISAADVLRWTTSNGARLCLDADSGSVEVGKRADLIVVNGDPVADMRLLLDPARNLDAVLLSGRFVKNKLGAQNVPTVNRTHPSFIAATREMPEAVAAE